MAPLRTLCALLVATLLAVGLSGAVLVSAAHAQEMGEVRFEQGLSVETTGAMDECCQDKSHRAASCASFMGVAPDVPELCPSSQSAKTISVRSVSLSDGRDPHDLLDPPRTT